MKNLNRFLDEQKSNDWLEKLDYLDDILNTDELFQNKVPKSSVKHTIYMNLSLKDLGFDANNYYDAQNRIDLEKFTSFIEQFQYFNFNGNLFGDLSQKKMSADERIRLKINVPTNTKILFLEDGRAILDRDIGIIVSRISIFSEGRQYIRMDAEVVSKEDVYQEIKSDEAEINTMVQDKLGIDRNDLVEINAKSLISNYTAVKAKESINHLINSIPSDLLLQSINSKNNGSLKINFSDKILDGEDHVIGFFDHNNNTLNVKISCNNDNSELYTVVHEFGHSVDYNLLGYGDVMHSQISSKFENLYLKEKENLTEETSRIVDFDEHGNGITYGSVNPAEFFAEVFANIYSSDQSRKELIWRQVPETCQYIVSQISQYLNGS